MTVVPRRLAHLVPIALAILVGGCPPPPDGAPDEVAAAPGSAPAAIPGAEPPPGERSSGSPVPVRVEESPGVPRAPEPSGTPTRVVYEQLAGGVFVPRCAACGEVQRQGSEKCGACGQALVPWRHESVCPLCTGEGNCERCGDDRRCAACEADGRCGFCDGTGGPPDDRCTECSGTGRCVACRGDGWRESTEGDFLPLESWLPGVCPTCVDGSGLCPECGTLGTDAAGAPCASCGGDGICLDCGGEGHCPHDAADGRCLGCAGGGREVVNGAPRPPGDRIRNLRTAAGTVVTARVRGRPSPNLPYVTSQGGQEVPQSLPRSQVHPLTYYLATRDFLPGSESGDRPAARELGEAYMQLAAVAQAAGYWPLVKLDLRRARTADPELAPQVAAQLADLEQRWASDWIRRAEKARAQGDLDGATTLLQMAAFRARGTAHATRAEVLLLQIRRQEQEEDAALTSEDRARAESEAQASVERTLGRAAARLRRARSLLESTSSVALPDQGTQRLFTEADHAAWSAWRLVLQEAHRHPPATTAWPVRPDVAAGEARLLRATIASARAAREIGGGRYAVGERLCLRALELDPSAAEPRRLLESAREGLARRGVLQGSPPPRAR